MKNPHYLLFESLFRMASQYEKKYEEEKRREKSPRMMMMMRVGRWADEKKLVEFGILCCSFVSTNTHSRVEQKRILRLKIDAMEAIKLNSLFKLHFFADEKFSNHSFSFLSAWQIQRYELLG